AERGVPGHAMGKVAAVLDDGRGLGHGTETVVHVTPVAQVVAHSLVELDVIGRAADPATEIAEILDEEVLRARLPDLQLVTAGVNAAEDPGEIHDDQIVLGDVAPGLGPRQGPGAELLEVL